MGTRAKRRSMWPAVAACTLAGAAIVTALLVPLDPTARTWIVRGLLIALLVGVCIWVVARGRVTPTRANRPERVAFQAAFFWSFFTGVTFAVPASGDLEPLRAVITGLVAGALFGVGLLALDPWVVRRTASRSSPHVSPLEGSEKGSNRP